MMKRALILGSIVLLAACTQQNKQDMKQNAHTDMDRVKDAIHLEVQEMNRSIQEWIKPEPRPEPQPITTSSYCYHSYGDVVCYKDPMPKSRERLVGYQEPALTGPADVNAVPPPTVTVTTIKSAPIAPPYAQAKTAVKTDDTAMEKDAADDKKKPLNPYEPRTLIPSAL